jgi:hypothetical protein
MKSTVNAQQMALIEIEVAFSKIGDAYVSRVRKLAKPMKVKLIKVKKKKDKINEDDVNLIPKPEPDPEPDPNYGAITDEVVHRHEIINFFKLAETYIGSGELKDLPKRIDAFANFARSFKDDNNPVLYEVSREMYPLIEKLKSLTHIALGHPEDAAKRAKKISNKVSSL